jgi:hypothetical protein
MRLTSFRQGEGESHWHESCMQEFTLGMKPPIGVQTIYQQVPQLFFGHCIATHLLM